MSATDRIHETALAPPDGGLAELHERDFYAWALDQGQKLRDFTAAGLRLPGIDLDHLAEEIEDLGQEQRYQVEGHLRVAYSHLIKLALQPDSASVPHWTGEVVAALNNAEDRYTPAMRRAIDNDKVWRKACRQAEAILEASGINVPALPDICPFNIDALLSDQRARIGELVQTLRYVAP